MFEKDEAALAAMGAHITTREIKQQPDLWESTLEIYQEKSSCHRVISCQGRENGWREARARRARRRGKPPHT